MNTKISTALLLVLTVLFSGCTNYYKKGNKDFSNLQYHKAIEDYKNAIAEQDKHDHEAKIKLAECYRLINDYKNAELTYAEVVNYPEIEPSNYFHYARVLMNKGDYESAKIWLKKYLVKIPDDVVAKMLLSSCNSVNQFMKDTMLYTLKNVYFPGFSSVFASIPYGNGIVFTANKEEGDEALQEPRTGKSFYDLYFSEKDKNDHWLNPHLLSGDINGYFHEGPATFNKAGNIVYFTRSNYIESEAIKSSKDENNLKIFSAKLINDQWSQLEELPFNNDEYSVGHPYLSNDEKRLYFISDMPGGFGGTDIYYSVLNGTTWSKPENLGKEINTPGNEMFPFMSADGTFYFSSDAHNSFGGLDVFATSYDNITKKWLKVENLNYPLNSSKDDFAFYVDNKTETGFISSNRKESDVIYEFKKNEPIFNLSGTVTVKGKGVPFEGVTVTLVYENNDAKKEKKEVLTDVNGEYHFKLNTNTDYVVYASKENYFTQSIKLTTKGEKYSRNFVVNFELDQIIIEKPIVLENIYYDFDKYNIRPDAAIELDKLVKLLEDNPTIYIEMGSHTDCRGTDEYNFVLSNNRAKAAVEYLVLNGINEKRLTYKGYGEAVLVNHCKDDVWCSEEDHQKNRRTEFKVVKIVK